MKNVSEMVSGGSRTPSPGSSLSRKSSFANLFRKSEVTGSPDSQGGISRKKSGPLTGMLKDASDGWYNYYPEGKPKPKK